MKKMLTLLCLLLALCAPAVLAESAAQVSFGAVSVPADAAYIDLGEQVVGDWDAYVAFLNELPNLKKADMFATVVERRDIKLLEEHFPDVRFGWTIHIAREHYIRTDQTAFSTLHGSCPNHTSKEFEVLKYCTELRALDIGHNNVTDLSFLKPLTKLRVLILACNPELRSIDVLAELKDLEYLELFSCNIYNLAPLKELPRLMDLDIAYNKIGKYDALYEMPQLRRLWMPQSGLPIRGEKFEALQAALPDTWIMTDGHPTANGWREGNHYETIYTMFRANEYIPFEDSWPLEELPTEE